MKIVILNNKNEIWKEIKNLERVVLNFETFCVEGYYNETDSVVLQVLTNETIYIEEER